MDVNAREFRNALGCFATGVCVVTVKAARGRTAGITVNSFSSVSLKPPLALWCLGNDSWAFADFARARVFSVFVLGEKQRALSRYFSRKNVRADTKHLRALDRACARFDCRVTKRLKGGDHVVIVGRVTKFSYRGGAPLVYHRGKYRRLA